MVVICPKCKVKLRVADEKVAPEGMRFKCPKCSTVLMVKGKMAVSKPKALDPKKVLIAHEDPAVKDRMTSILTAAGFNVIAANDGIEAMVMVLKELPSIAVLGVSIPKIYGFDVCKKLKDRQETKEIKVILVASLHREGRYRREPVTLHDADGYIEPQQIEELLMRKIDILRGIEEKEPEREPEKREEEGIHREAEAKEGEGAKEKEEKLTRQAAGKQPAVADPMIEKAKRLARTIIGDIYLYSKAKMDNAIMNNTFHSAFESDLKEGYKLYLNRVSSEVRESGDFFNEAINNFIEQRKQELIK